MGVAFVGRFAVVHGCIPTKSQVSQALYRFQVRRERIMKSRVVDFAFGNPALDGISHEKCGHLEAAGTLISDGFLEDNCEVLDLDKCTDYSGDDGVVYLAQAISDHGRLANCRYLSIRDDCFPTPDTLVQFCKVTLGGEAMPSCERLNIGGLFCTPETLQVLVDGMRGHERGTNPPPRLKSVL